MVKVALVILMFLSNLLSVVDAHGTTRCEQFINVIRRANAFYFGINFPYWYAVAQAQTESNCRPSIVAFDAGQGIFQFMPATSLEVRKQIGMDLDPMNPDHAARMNAFYMKRLHRQNWDGGLWLTYSFYNSGPGTMKKEYLRAGCTDYLKMKAVCKRKILTLKSGKLLDLCQVGYDYPVLISQRSKSYRFGSDGMRYW